MTEPLVRRAEILEDEVNLHVLPLSVLLLDALGAGYLNWSSEALRAECEERWGKIGVVTWERIQALRIMHLHDAFWQEWEVFEKITAAILGEAPIFSLVQPPEAAEIAIALSVAKRIDASRTYDDDVRGYIAAACLHDGLWYLESELAEAAEAEVAAFDQQHGIVRQFGAVAEELAKSSSFRTDTDDPILSQVNRVLDVRSVLQQYNAAVEQQLKKLPELLKGK